MMALVEAARKVRAITTRTCAHRQMGSQCGRRERLWPSSVDVGLDVTSVANAYRMSREALISSSRDTTRTLRSTPIL